MKEKTTIDVQGIKMALFRRKLVTIKKSMPKQVTYLSTIKKANGDVYIKAVVNKKDYLYTMPHNYDFTNADWERLEELIKGNCDVTERS